ncbi:hypothetical protein SJAV_25350 [Sulfurisphaera javensis]|uniref:Uncharacterized protein n=1 Tax=Sulfurisphaera javensis TaxID=2049879 RepID=A0AAT9GVD0_9CREN
MKFIYLGIILIIIGISLLSLVLLANSKYVKINSKVELYPNSTYEVPYIGNAEVLFSYNFTSPVEVFGYPSSAVKINDSLDYVICFFSSSPGNITIKNNNVFPSIVNYTLYETSGIGLYSDYLISLGPIIITSGIVLIIYEKIIRKRPR